MKIITTLCFGSMLLLAACNSPKQEDEKQTDKPAVEQTSEPSEQQPIIMFFGNSITAGYGLDQEDAFPAEIQRILDSLGYAYQVVNAGLSGETSAGGVNRIEWVLQTIPDVFVLELGANDGLRGIELTSTRKNLIQIVEKVKEKNSEVKVFIAGMEVPPNLGEAYTSEFRSIFPAVADSTGAELIPFILAGVAGEPDLNQGDGIHPTEEGAEIVAKNIWKYLQPHLKQPTP